MAIIKVENVTKIYQVGEVETRALNGVTIDIDAGEFTALVGPSGSGKTTLLMVLAGLEPPTGGSVTVAGSDYGAMNEDDLARFRRTHIGIVFQSFHLVPTMTALENTALPLELAGEKDCRARAAAIPCGGTRGTFRDDGEQIKIISSSPRTVPTPAGLARARRNRDSGLPARLIPALSVRRAHGCLLLRDSAVPPRYPCAATF